MLTSQCPYADIEEFDMNDLPEKEPNQIVSTKYVAKIADVDPRTVRRWCKSGDLKATLLGNNYVIVWSDFLNFWQERHK